MIKDIATFTLPFITAALSTWVAIHKNNAKIKEVREQGENEIKRIETEMQNKAVLYEKNTQADILKFIMENVVKSLPQTKRSIDIQISSKLRNGNLDVIEIFKKQNT